MTQKSDNKRIDSLIQQLKTIRNSMVEAEQGYIAVAGLPHSAYAESQRNLLHYLALRRQDLRPLQQELTMLGLSSLGRAESHVLGSIDAVLTALSSLSGNGSESGKAQSYSPRFKAGSQLLEVHTQKLLGTSPLRRSVRIMVTIPSEAETDYTLIHSLLWQGMDIARINCAHDSPAVWERMIRHIRRAEKAQGRSCRILMDLGGPKLRTGPIEPGPAVLKWKPQRDATGVAVSPARIWITPSEKRSPPPTEPNVTVPVPADWMSRLRIGDRIHFTDARESKRCVTIVDVTGEGCWGESWKTAYVTPGTLLTRRDSKDENDAVPVGDFDPLPGCIELAVGDILILTRELQPGRRATSDCSGRILTPARIGCTLPEIFNDVQTGERVWFDDGKIGGTIEKTEPDRIFVRITQAKPEGEKLRSDKGINLPDSSLKLPALTQKDLEDLAFVAAHADMVGLSFAQSATDVELLLGRLNLLGRSDLGIILKIETRRGFDQLPAMLLAGMKSPSIGVMIARGDLAVESGFERMAEVQEEILWICEAAQCPVIWATQVLESLAKQGMASRAEITDAAMGHRAEAVMLNKGPHILRAVQMLDDILQRMEAHQVKKQSMMRELSLARNFMSQFQADALESATAGPQCSAR
jgi:pyruvate kinase